MAEETTGQFLDRREKDLTAQIAALRGQLLPKEAELAQIQKMKAALAPIGPTISSLALALDSGPPHNALAEPYSPLRDVPFPTVSLGEALQPSGPYAEMTIKELVIKGLIDGFPNGGTMMDIRDFIRSGYGRTIEPSSMRPQMHRLKADGILAQDASTDTWNFQDSRQRLLYAKYHHSTPRAAMTELQDAEPDSGDTDRQQRWYGKDNKKE